MEHQTMLTCPCNDSDRLTFLCLLCGKVHAPDPSFFSDRDSRLFLHGPYRVLD